jgi:hypothetical protein
MNRIAFDFYRDNIDIAEASVCRAHYAINMGTVQAGLADILEAIVAVNLEEMKRAENGTTGFSDVRYSDREALVRGARKALELLAVAK